MASHHFAVIATLAESLVPEPHSGTRRQHIDTSSLKNPLLARAFAESFESQLTGLVHSEGDDINEMCARTDDAFSESAETVLPKSAPVRRRPWISNDTIDLIEKRRLARNAGNSQGEKDLQHEFKGSARNDKKQRLLELAGTGTWAAAKHLRSGTSRSQGRINDENGY